jgi:16S rRNA processing protein RimM
VPVTSSKDSFIVVGKISGVYGVRGWLRVYSHTEPRENILNYKTWYLEQRGEWIPYQLIDGRKHGKGIVVELSSVDDRDKAATILQRKVAIKIDELPLLEEGEYYWRDLIGLTVQDLNAVIFGKVVDLMETGSNDVLIVREKDEEYLIPYIPGDVIHKVDMENSTIIVDWDREY